MIRFEVMAEVEQLVYEGNKSFKYLVKRGNDKLEITITKSNLGLSESIEMGKSYKLIGNLNAYIIEKENGTFINNIFYVDAFISIDDLDHESIYLNDRRGQRS